METIEDIVREMRSGKLSATVECENCGSEYEQRFSFDTLADRIEAAHKRAVTNCNQLKTREALKYLRDASQEFCHLILNSKYIRIFDKYKYPEVARIRDAIANAGVTLSAPARNCDVGTVKEQTDRYTKFCGSHKNTHGNCISCPACKMVGRCEFHWSQMPYEEVEE